MACKCVFYRTKKKCKGGNFKGLEMQQWNIQIDRAWRVDQKNGVIFLVIKFVPRVMVIKMSKNGSWFVFFFRWQQNICNSLGKTCKCTQMIFLSLSANGMVNWFWRYRSCVIEGRNIKKCWVSKKVLKLYVFSGWYYKW